VVEEIYTEVLPSKFEDLVSALELCKQANTPCGKEGCKLIMLDDRTCQPECFVLECDYDQPDCINELCAPECLPHMIDDGECQNVCFNEFCNNDGEDCEMNPEMCDDPYTIAVYVFNSSCDSLCEGQVVSTAVTGAPSCCDDLMCLMSYEDTFTVT
jgi:hypothetical protein